MPRLGRSLRRVAFRSAVGGSAAKGIPLIPVIFGVGGLVMAAVPGFIAAGAANDEAHIFRKIVGGIFRAFPESIRNGAIRTVGLLVMAVCGVFLIPGESESGAGTLDDPIRLEVTILDFARAVQIVHAESLLPYRIEVVGEEVEMVFRVTNPVNARSFDHPVLAHMGSGTARLAVANLMASAREQLGSPRADSFPTAPALPPDITPLQRELAGSRMVEGEDLVALASETALLRRDAGLPPVTAEPEPGVETGVASAGAPQPAGDPFAASDPFATSDPFAASAPGAGVAPASASAIAPSSAIASSSATAGSMAANQPAAASTAAAMARPATPFATPASPTAPADVLVEKARAKWDEGNFDASILLAERALEIYRAHLPAEHPTIAKVSAMVDAAYEKAK